MNRVVSVIFGISAMAFIGGCASVKIPDVDFFKLPEYAESQKDADYPKVSEAPRVPTDTRPDVEWDSAARTMLKTRDGFVAPESGTPDRSPEEVKREFEALRAKVNEYKKDDPQ